MTGAAARPAGALATLAAGFLASALLRAGDVIAALPPSAEDGFGRALPVATASAPGAAGDAALAIVA